MPIRYDPDIVQEYAEDLYDQARSLVIYTALRYFLVAAGLGCVGMAFVWKELPQASVILLLLSIFCIGLATLTGMNAGRAKGFHLKLEAQTLLCQRQIEFNTRERPQSC